MPLVVLYTPIGINERVYFQSMYKSIFQYNRVSARGKSKKFGHWTLESGDKKTVKRSEKHRYQKKSCSVRQNVPRTNFFCPTILHSLLVFFLSLRPRLSIKFYPRIPNLQKFGHPTSGSGSKKTFKRYLKREQTHRHTHIHGQINL